MHSILIVLAFLFATSASATGSGSSEDCLAALLSVPHAPEKPALSKLRADVDLFLAKAGHPSPKDLVELVRTFSGHAEGIAAVIRYIDRDDQGMENSFEALFPQTEFIAPKSNENRPGDFAPAEFFFANILSPEWSKYETRIEETAPPDAWRVRVTPEGEFEKHGYSQGVSFETIRRVFRNAVIEPDSVFYDFGAGYATLLLWGALLRPDVKFKGVEMVPERTELAQKMITELKIKNLELVTSDVRDVDFSDATHILLNNPFPSLISEMAPKFLALGKSKSMRFMLISKYNYLGGSWFAPQSRIPGFSRDLAAIEYNRKNTWPGYMFVRTVSPEQTAQLESLSGEEKDFLVRSFELSSRQRAEKALPEKYKIIERGFFYYYPRARGKVPATLEGWVELAGRERVRLTTQWKELNGTVMNNLPNLRLLTDVSNQEFEVRKADWKVRSDSHKELISIVKDRENDPHFQVLLRQFFRARGLTYYDGDLIFPE